MSETYYRKYRPNNFSTVIGQEHIVEVLTSQLSSLQVGNSYIFIGPRGTGKTSVARIFAKAINCLDLTKNGDACGKCENCKLFQEGKSLDIVEIDAASNRGIDDIKQLKEKIGFAPIKYLKKVYIIDEVHMLSKDAFNALLKTLEEPPTYAIFILATTEGQKVPHTILSRCQRFDFKLASMKELETMIKDISLKEKKNISDEVIELVAELGKGSYRDSLTILQKLLSHQTTDKIDIEGAHKILGLSGYSNILKLFENIYEYNFEDSLKLSKKIFHDGISPNQISSQLIRYTQKVLTINKYQKSRVYEILEGLFNLEKRMKYTDFDEIAFELFLFKLTERLNDNEPQKGSDTKEKEEVEKKKEKSADVKVLDEKIITKDEEVNDKKEGKKNRLVENWQNILKEIRKESSMLYGTLSSAKIIFEDNSIVIYVKSKFLKDRIENTKSKNIINTVLLKEFNTKADYVVKVSRAEDFEEKSKNDIVKDVFSEMLV